LTAGLPGLPARLGEGLAGIVERRLLEGVVLLRPGVDPTLGAQAPGRAAAVVTAQGATDAAQGVSELARDDPHLVRVALGQLRQDLEVLVGEQPLRRLAPVDRVEDLLDGPRLPLRLEDRGLRRPLRAEDLRLLLALRG